MTIFKMSQPIPVRHHHKHHNLKHRFDLIKTLGQGTYGKVKLAVDRLSGEKVAIKSIKKKKIENDQDLVRVKREIEIMSSLSHPHIVNIQEVFENKDKIILVMEYASGGELYDYISDKTRLEEKEARKIFRQIVSAVHHCHTNGVVHRDLKLENILLDENGDVKIADFGLSNMWSDAGQLSTFCGSPLYASPEIVNGVPYHGPEVDCWSLGVLLYTLVYGAMPFDGSDFRRLRKQISEGDYYEPSQPSECSSLIRHLLTVSPKSRATLKDICNHWWTNLHHQSSPVESPARVDSAFEEEQLFDGQHFTFGSDSDLESGQKTPVSATKCENRTSDFYEDEIVEAQLAISAALAKCNISSDRTVAPSSVDQVDYSSGSKSQYRYTQEPAQPSSKASDVIFDSERKPKKSILKNKGRYSGGDSGCVLSSKVRAEAQLDDDGAYSLSDIEKILDPSSQSEQQRRDSGVESSSSDPSTPIGDLSTVVCEAAANTAVVKRRGILKKNSRYSTDSDLASKRYSIGSLSSNSSGDILDFSYNSSDGEQYMGGARYYLPPDQQHVFYDEGPKQCNSVNVFGDSRDEVASKIDMLDRSLDSTPKQSYDALAHTFDQREGKRVFEKALKLCQ